MGIIKKQGIQGTISIYFGVAIGFIINSYLLPKILNKEEVGLIHTLLAYSIVFAQFSTLGFMSVVTKMFSYFRNNNNKHNSFFFFLLSITVIGSIVCVVLFYVLKQTIVGQNAENSPLFVKYVNYLIPFSIFTVIFYQLDNYYTVLFKAVRGLILKEVVQRLMIILSLVLFYFEVFEIEGFVVGYTIAIAIPAIVLVILLVAEGEFIIKPKLDFVSKDMAKTMFSVGLFGILSGLVGSINMQIDKAMTTSMISLEVTGVYSTVIAFALFIKTPSKAILKIASAIIAEAWKRNDVSEIKKIYKETAYNQFLFAVLVLVGLYVNLDNIFIILPQYESGRYVILIIGVSYTIEMASGAANNIIATSKYYKYLTLFVAFMVIIAVIFNLIFIPLFAINGVAIATGLTVVFYTLVKVAFIYMKLKMHSFSLKFLYILIIGGVCIFFSLLLPQLDFFMLDILIRSFIVAIIYLGLIYIFNLSDELIKVTTTIFNNFKR